eukprot:TRINITY_DN13927_c0_g1_i1.p1 TRINITY_DN13927_c0_g1~~TRINITY_DN13927_c0_g1_i1.p1  ORF type:complete len:263 (+),score=64.95 TRINITY_DN13927_c0_g1_i1:90-878(+)
MMTESDVTLTWEFPKRIKMCLIGESGVGKTQFMISAAESPGADASIVEIKEDNKQQIGVDFRSVSFRFKRHGDARFVTESGQRPNEVDVEVKCHVWDTPGKLTLQQLSMHSSKTYFRGVDALLLCYDVTDSSTLTALKDRWLPLLLRGTSVEHGSCSFFLIGNKADLLKNQAGDDELTSVSEEMEECVQKITQEMNVKRRFLARSSSSSSSSFTNAQLPKYILEVIAQDLYNSQLETVEEFHSITIKKQQLLITWSSNCGVQ